MRIFFGLLLLVGCASARASGADTCSTALPQHANVRDCAPIAICCSYSASGPFWIAESPNFRICRYGSDATHLSELAETCERTAAVLRERWLGKQSHEQWVPKCDVVVHRGVAEYVQCLGPGSEGTSGCSTIQFDQGRVVSRRLDLRADAADWTSDCLPHELTHVVLADRFTQVRIPPWADEGIAILAESPNKLNRRVAVLRQAASTGTVFSVRDLMNVRSCPPLKLRDAFYGQSVVLTHLFLGWGTREQFLQFVESSQIKGFDVALRDAYPKRSLSELERRLSNDMLTGGSSLRIAASYRSR
jgi:hypothetical protein